MSEENNTAVIEEVDVQDNGSSMSVSANLAPAPDPMDNLALVMPDKFSNAEDPQQALLKAYSEMEKKFSQGGSDVKTEPVQEPTADPVGEVSDNTGDSPSDNTGGDTDSTTSETTEPDVSKFSQLWDAQEGTLTDEQWADASKEHGVTVDEAKEFAQWKSDKQQGVVQDAITASDSAIYEAVGGNEAYTNMEAWASESLDVKALGSLEAMLANPDLAVQGAQVLKSMYDNRSNIEPTSSVNAESPTTSSEGLESEEEMAESMADPLYRTSEKYRRQHREKMIVYMKKTGQLSK
jgi:hypothetical protein